MHLSEKLRELSDRRLAQVHRLVKLEIERRAMDLERLALDETLTRGISVELLKSDED